MKDFVTLPFVLGVYPAVTAKDSSGGAALDGTPQKAQWVSEVFGVFQALLDAAGLTPDAATEAAGTSQVLQAIQMISGYPGELAPFANVAIPAGVRLLALEGQGIVRANYARLDAAVYVGNPLNLTAPAYFRADNADGTGRNVAGVWLILPDLRGLFLRGYNPSGTYDPGGGSRGIGDVQLESIKQHEHDRLFHATTEMLAGNMQEGAGATKVVALDGGTALINVGPTGTSIGSGVTNETRPDNSAIKWCIRF